MFSFIMGFLGGVCAFAVLALAVFFVMVRAARQAPRMDINRKGQLDV